MKFSTLVRTIVMGVVACVSALMLSTPAHAGTYIFTLNSQQVNGVVCQGGCCVVAHNTCDTLFANPNGSGKTVLAWFDNANGKFLSENVLGVGCTTTCLAAMTASGDYTITCGVKGNKTFLVCSDGLSSCVTQNLVFTATGKEKTCCQVGPVTHCLAFCSCGKNFSEDLTIPSNTLVAQPLNLFNPDGSSSEIGQIQPALATPEPGAMLVLLLGAVALKKYLG